MSDLGDEAVVGDLRVVRRPVLLHHPRMCRAVGEAHQYVPGVVRALHVRVNVCVAVATEVRMLVRRVDVHRKAFAHDNCHRLGEVFLVSVCPLCLHLLRRPYCFVDPYNCVTY